MCTAHVNPIIAYTWRIMATADYILIRAYSGLTYEIQYLWTILSLIAEAFN